MGNLEDILFKRNLLKDGAFAFYRLEGEQPKCATIVTVRNEALDLVSWLYHERIEPRWALAESIVLNENNEPASGKEFFYLNLHAKTGIQNLTITDNVKNYGALITRYQRQDLASGQQNNEDDETQQRVFFLGYQEAQERQKKYGLSDYAVDEELLKKDPTKCQNLNVDLALPLEEMRYSDGFTLQGIRLYADMEDLKAIEDLESRKECFDYDLRVTKDGVDIKKHFPNPTLGRIMHFTFTNLYLTYMWLIGWVKEDKRDGGNNVKAHLTCLTAAQYCAQNMQAVADEFKVKIILHNENLPVIMPSQGVINYTFEFSELGVPMIHVGNRNPSLTRADGADVLAEFCDIYSNDLQQLEQAICEIITTVQESSGQVDEAGEQLVKDIIKTVSEQIGTPRKKRSNPTKFNIREEFPIYCDTVETPGGGNKELRKSKSFKFLQMLTEVPTGQSEVLNETINFNVLRDGAVRSTEVPVADKPSSDAKFRGRSRSRSRERDSATWVHDDSRRVSFARTVSPAKDTQQCHMSQMRRITNIKDEDLPLVSSVNKANPEFTSLEDSDMGVSPGDDELTKLDLRLKWIDGNAPEIEDHEVISSVESIFMILKQTAVHLPQTVEEVKSMETGKLKSLSRNLGAVEGFTKNYAKGIAALKTLMNKGIAKNTLSDVAWKLGKKALKMANEDSDRLLQLYKVCEETMDERHVIRGSKDFNIESLKLAVKPFSGQSLSSDKNARSFQQFKTTLESHLKFHHADTQQWGYYASHVLEGAAKDTLDREFPGVSNPDYTELMAALEKNHGQPADVFKAVKRTQLMLAKIRDDTANGVKQSVTQEHRRCLEQLRHILRCGNQYEGMVLAHLKEVAGYFPYVHKIAIRNTCDDPEKDVEDVIKKIHAVCDYLFQEARDDENADPSPILQNFALESGARLNNNMNGTMAGKNGMMRKPTEFQLKSMGVEDCLVCKNLEARKIQPRPVTGSHIVTPKGSPIFEGCPGLRELNTEARSNRMRLLNLCRVCAKKELGNGHTEEGCTFQIPYLKCKQEGCKKQTSFCGDHKEMNYQSHEKKRLGFQRVGLNYIYSCQPVLEKDGNQEDTDQQEISQAFLAFDPPRYTHGTTRDMIRNQERGTIVSDKAGKAIFPMGLLEGLDGKIYPYVYDSGSSQSSILRGADGKVFNTAPVDPGEASSGGVMGVSGVIQCSIVNILVPLVDDKMSVLKVHVLPNTLQCQTENLQALADDLMRSAREAGVMGYDEEIQCPDYGRRAILMLGKSHEHLAPRAIYTDKNGLVLYESKIKGPMLRNGRTLCIGGSYHKGEVKERLAHLWATMPAKEWGKPAIIEGSHARRGVMGVASQNLSQTLTESAMLAFSNQPDMVNAIVHGENRLLASASEYSRNVSDVIKDCHQYALSGGEIHDGALIERRRHMAAGQNFLAQVGLDER